MFRFVGRVDNHASHMRWFQHSYPENQKYLTPTHTYSPVPSTHPHASDLADDTVYLFSDDAPRDIFLQNEGNLNCKKIVFYTKSPRAEVKRN